MNEKDKELEEFKKILPYLFEEEDSGLLKFLPIVTFIFQVIILLILIFKK